MLERDPGAREPATRTGPARGAPVDSGEILGILWLVPEERFHPLGPGSTIGRGDDCALRLDDLGISRRQARIEREGAVWMLRDLGSKNGSFVNGQRRELAPLSAHDTVRLGDWVGVVCRLPPEAVVSRRYFGELVPGLTFGMATLASLAGLPMLAASDVPIVVCGETGTGKEVLARAIHDLSGRRGDLVAIDCSAIPEGLAEAELFGHRKGAFTGAVESMEGRIVAARGGTLFLDEIADLPLPIQAKLLRVLEDRAVTPLGSSRPVPVDFRVVAASQLRLEALVRAGRFRADLHARLSGAELALPPMRERREEVVRLLRSVLRQALGQLPELDSALVERLCIHSWPYNVREVVQLGRLLGASKRTSFARDDLPARFLQGSAPEEAEVSGSSGRPSRRQLWLSRYVADLGRLKSAMSACRGNVTEAARSIGMPRHRARRLLEAEAAVAQSRETRHSAQD
jgi:transcriptional regulator with AAA-type ATPase domain